MPAFYMIIAIKKFFPMGARAPSQKILLPVSYVSDNG